MRQGFAVLCKKRTAQNNSLRRRRSLKKMLHMRGAFLSVSSSTLPKMESLQTKEKAFRRGY